MAKAIKSYSRLVFSYSLRFKIGESPLACVLYYILIHLTPVYLFVPSMARLSSGFEPRPVAQSGQKDSINIAKIQGSILNVRKEGFCLKITIHESGVKSLTSGCQRIC